MAYFTTHDLGLVASYMTVYSISIALLLSAFLVSTYKKPSLFIGLVAAATSVVCGLPPSPLFFVKLGLLSNIYSNLGLIGVFWGLSSVFFFWICAVRFLLWLAIGVELRGFRTTRRSSLNALVIFKLSLFATLFLMINASALLLIS